MTPPCPDVLFLAPFEPWCRENGSSLITADLLSGIVTNGGVRMLAVFLRHPPHDGCGPRPADLESVTIGNDGLPAWVSVAKALLTGRSVLRLRFDNGPVGRKVLAAVKDRAFVPSLVHVEHLPLFDIGQRIASVYGCPLVYRAHNIESQLWARRLPRESTLRNWYIHRLEKGEVEALATADLSLCISETDLNWARAHVPADRLALLPGCLQFDRYADLLDRPAEPGRIGFVGGLEWGPNRDGLRWFVEEALPHVVEAAPDAHLAVLARGAHDCPWLVDNTAVRILPPESVPMELFASSAVSIAPLRQGGGVRIKILESLAVGCPVVATAVGGEGLHLPGLTCVDDPSAFAAACARDLGTGPDRSSRRDLAEAASRHHGAEAVARGLVARWSELANG